MRKGGIYGKEEENVGKDEVCVSAQEKKKPNQFCSSPKGASTFACRSGKGH